MTLREKTNKKNCFSLNDLEQITVNFTIIFSKKKLLKCLLNCTIGNHKYIKSKVQGIILIPVTFKNNKSYYEQQ